MTAAANDPLSLARRAIDAGDAAGAARAARLALRPRFPAFPDMTRLAAIGARLAKLDGAGPRLKAAVLSSSTADPFVTALRCVALAEGFVAEIHESPYGTIHQEILDPGSPLHQFGPELVLFHQDFEDLPGLPPITADADAAQAAVSGVIAGLRTLWTRLGEAGAKVLFDLYCPPPEAAMGVLDRVLPCSPASLAAAINHRVLAEAPAHVHVVDTDGAAAMFGRRAWRDERFYNQARMSLSAQALPAYAQVLSATFRRAQACGKKALVLDLDNTLWGGVIGDDGLDGIRLGDGGGEGVAFSRFAAYVDRLRQCGVILAVCSKNDPAIAGEVFERHPGMPLKKDSFAAFVCNWDDKAGNIVGIARQLDISPEHMVFVDDNPAECELVRDRLPEVTVVNLQGDPSTFIHQLDQLRLFESRALTDEDIRRSQSYAARAEAAALQRDSDDIDDYLRQLGMAGSVRPAEATDLPRLAQMESKTNQFNLTTRRFTEDHLAAFLASPDHLVLAVRLRDRFADHGLVSSVVARRDGRRLVIENWLMSCRVFSRTLEQFVLNAIVEAARTREVGEIVGLYSETPKNKVVSDLYGRLGFVAAGTGEWRLDVRGARSLPHHVADEATANTGTRA